MKSLIDRFRYKAYNPIISRWLRAYEIEQAGSLCRSSVEYSPDFESIIRDGGKLLRPTNSNNELALIYDQIVRGGVVVSGIGSTKRYKWIRSASMYDSWTVPPRYHFEDHVSSPIEAHPVEFESSAAVVFDSWGISSYYHLLIDTVIPLWATKLFLSEVCQMESFQDPLWWHISNNGSDQPLDSTQEIFQYFLGGRAKSHPSLVSADLCYGYLSGCRPYLGPRYKFELRPWVAYYLDRFRKQFRFDDRAQSNVILVPKRSDRIMPFVQYFLDKYSGKYEFKEVDFSAMSVREQISNCGTSAGLFGSEGAAFANQIFFQDRSLVVPVSNKRHKFLFHKPLSLYCNHYFVEAYSPDSGDRKKLECSCERLLDRFFEMRGVSP